MDRWFQERDRHALGIRFLEIDAELQALAERRVVEGDPAKVEERLLDEQEAIEFRLGEADFEERDRGR
jgi:hypothetical protein